MFMAMSVQAGNARPSGKNPASAPPPFAVHPPGDPRRAHVEDFIRDVYARRYGAQVRHFAPTLVSLHDGDGVIVAAAGYRCARDSRLFLERYLPGPVESLLEPVAGFRPARADIVEVGHLASSRAGEGRRLIFLLGPHLADQGCQWVVGTLTEELRHLFQRVGVTPLALGTADPDALGEDAARWGSYYDHRPQVLAGHLPQALRHLERRSGMPRTQE